MSAPCPLPAPRRFRLLPDKRLRTGAAYAPPLDKNRAKRSGRAGRRFASFSSYKAHCHE